MPLCLFTISAIYSIIFISIKNIYYYNSRSYILLTTIEFKTTNLNSWLNSPDRESKLEYELTDRHKMAVIFWRFRSQPQGAGPDLRSARLTLISLVKSRLVKSKLARSSLAFDPALPLIPSCTRTGAVNRPAGVPWRDRCNLTHALPVDV